MTAVRSPGSRSVAEKMGINEGWRAHVVAGPPGVVTSLELPSLVLSDTLEPPLLALRRVAQRRVLIERELAEAVRAARESGVPWRDIGEAVGTTGEAARQRYSRGAA